MTEIYGNLQNIKEAKSIQIKFLQFHPLTQKENKTVPAPRFRTFHKDYQVHHNGVTEWNLLDS